METKKEEKKKINFSNENKLQKLQNLSISQFQIQTYKKICVVKLIYIYFYRNKDRMQINYTWNKF